MATKYMVYVMTTIITIGVPTIIGIVYNDHVNQVVMAEDVSVNKNASKQNTETIQTIVTCMEVVKEQIKQINTNIREIKEDLKNNNKQNRHQR